MATLMVRPRRGASGTTSLMRSSTHITIRGHSRAICTINGFSTAIFRRYPPARTRSTSWQPTAREGPPHQTQKHSAPLGVVAVPTPLRLLDNVQARHLTEVAFRLMHGLSTKKTELPSLE